MAGGKGILGDTVVGLGTTVALVKLDQSSIVLVPDHWLCGHGSHQSVMQVFSFSFLKDSMSRHC